jgi:hypothetical protein
VHDENLNTTRNIYNFAQISLYLRLDEKTNQEYSLKDHLCCFTT